MPSHLKTPRYHNKRIRQIPDTMDNSDGQIGAMTWRRNSTIGGLVPFGTVHKNWLSTTQGKRTFLSVLSSLNHGLENPCSCSFWIFAMVPDPGFFIKNHKNNSD